MNPIPYLEFVTIVKCYIYLVLQGAVFDPVFYGLDLVFGQRF